MQFDVPKRVLIVDDDDGMRRVLARVLERAGWQTQEAVNGASIVSIVSEFNPVVVFLDLFMPGKNGVQILAELKLSFPWLQVVILTGYPSDWTAIGCLNGGAFKYLQKPCEHQVIIATCEAARSEVPLPLWAFNSWYHSCPDPKKIMYMTASGEELSVEKLMDEVRGQTEIGQTFLKRIMEVSVELIMKRLK